MNEAETRAELIDPALKAAGWGVVEASRVRREVVTLGRLQGAGVRAAQEHVGEIARLRLCGASHQGKTAKQPTHTPHGTTLLTASTSLQTCRDHQALTLMDG